MLLFFFLFKYFLCQGYELSGEIALKNNHYYYYYYCTTSIFTPALRFLLPKMNFGSSVLHIVVEPATDFCRYVGVADTIVQLLVVHIVECSCQIEPDEYCSVSRLFLLRSAAMSAVIVDNTVYVECFDRKPC